MFSQLFSDLLAPRGMACSKGPWQLPPLPAAVSLCPQWDSIKRGGTKVPSAHPTVPGMQRHNLTRTTGCWFSWTPVAGARRLRRDQDSPCGTAAACPACREHRSLQPLLPGSRTRPKGAPFRRASSQIRHMRRRELHGADHRRARLRHQLRVRRAWGPQQGGGFCSAYGTSAPAWPSCPSVSTAKVPHHGRS